MNDDDEQPDECDGCHEEKDYLQQFEGWSGLKQWLCEECHERAAMEE